jgi:predicted HicB family RNase H-like nuclease
VTNDHYTYRVSWSPEDSDYVATVAEFRSLSWLAPNQSEALEGLRELVADVVADLLAAGEPAPEPLADRAYSGEFRLRIPPSVHRALTIEAAEQGVSLNRLVSAKVSAH